MDHNGCYFPLINFDELSCVLTYVGLTYLHQTHLELTYIHQQHLVLTYLYQPHLCRVGKRQGLPWLSD